MSGQAVACAAIATKSPSGIILDLFLGYIGVLVDRAGGTQNGVHFAANNRQRLLAEEAELDRMVKELQATLPPSEGELVSHKYVYYYYYYIVFFLSLIHI